MTITKLSELMTAETVPEEIWGLEADTECLTPPPNLKRASFLWKGQGDDMHDDLLDAIISFGLANVDVIVEITASDNVNTNKILPLAGNVGFSIALLPENKDSHEDTVWENWENLCAAYCEGFLTTRNLTKEIHPVSNHFGYLVLETLAGDEAANPNDTYLQQRFVKALPDDKVNQAKEKMKKTFHDIMGGETEFKTFIRQMSTDILVEAANLHFDNLNSQEHNAENTNPLT